MTQLHERDATASVRPALPHVETSGFEILGDEERAVQQAMHEFAREVMRPAGTALDKLSAEEVVAPGSSYWEFVATARRRGSGSTPPPRTCRRRCWPGSRRSPSRSSAGATWA